MNSKVPGIGGPANNVSIVRPDELRISCKRGVKAGEELLLDYGQEYWETEERKATIRAIRTERRKLRLKAVPPQG